LLQLSEHARSRFVDWELSRSQALVLLGFELLGRRQVRVTLELLALVVDFTTSECHQRSASTDHRGGADRQHGAHDRGVRLVLFDCHASPQ
jgi:hypothetical protein